jgi:hypothetical protein
MPDGAQEDACGWKELTPAPPARASATADEKEGANAMDVMNKPAMAGARVEKRGERYRSER